MKTPGRFFAFAAASLLAAANAGTAAAGEGALDDAFLDREIKRTQPDFVVYRPFAADGHDDHGNEHFHVFHVRNALCALWTQSAYEGTFTQRPVFSRSFDGGKTWSAPKCILRDPIDPKTGRNMGSWAAAAVSKSGRIYVLYAKHLGDGTDHETGKMHVLCSDDLGETWSPEAPFAQPHDPRYDLDTPAKPVSLFPWQNAYRLSDGSVLMALSHNYKNPAANPEPRKYWPEAPGACEFMRFDNVDADPAPADLKATYFARNEKGLHAPLFTDPSRPSGEEPAVVELPDGRLMCVFRACEGHVWYSVSADKGETWRPCEMLRYRDGGAGVEHPYSPSPMFRTAENEYVLFTHNSTGRCGGPRPRTDGNWRNPLYLLKGEFRPGAHQPVWFSEPKKIMDNGGVKIKRMDLAMYADLTVEPEGPVFWYPDRKFFLLGKKLAPLLKDMRVPRND